MDEAIERIKYLLGSETDGDLSERLFMLCDAAYWWLMENYGGQFSPEYSLMCRIGTVYTPSRLARESAFPELTNVFDEYWLVACDAIASVFDELNEFEVD